MDRAGMRVRACRAGSDRVVYGGQQPCVAKGHAGHWHAKQGLGRLLSPQPARRPPPKTPRSLSDYSPTMAENPATIRKDQGAKVCIILPQAARAGMNRLRVPHRFVCEECV